MLSIKSVPILNLESPGTLMNATSNPVPHHRTLAHRRESGRKGWHKSPHRLFHIPHENKLVGRLRIRMEVLH